jgi:hypothetical protein
MERLMSKILSGSLFGLGFSIPFFICFYVLQDYQNKNIFSVSDEIVAMENFGIEIDHRLQVRGKKSEIIGHLINTTESKLSNVNLQIDIYGPDNQLVYICEDNFKGKLRAKSKRGFMVTCNTAGVKDTTYKISVIGASDYNW